jgi:serine/threonine-protein kinase RsbW
MDACQTGAFQRTIAVYDADDLPKVFAFMEDACRDAPVDPQLCFDLQLVVEEACCNVIEHAYEGTGGEFTVCFAAPGRDVIITLHDHGRPFKPSEIAPPDLTLPLEERPIGGLGLYIIYQLMDDVQFSFTDDGNTLVMVKRNAIQGKEEDG